MNKISEEEKICFETSITKNGTDWQGTLQGPDGRILQFRSVTELLGEMDSYVQEHCSREHVIK